MGRRKKRDYTCDRCGHDIIGEPLKLGGKITCSDGCVKTGRLAAWNDAMASLSEDDS